MICNGLSQIRGMDAIHMSSLQEQQLDAFYKGLKGVMLNKAQKAMPWYDAAWLHQFIVAQKLIKQFQPSKLNDFIHAFDRLRTDPNFEVKHVKDTLKLDVLNKVKEIISLIPREDHKSHEVESFGRLIVHDQPYFTELQRAMVPFVSELAGEEVEASYNFLSLYSGFGVCEPHIDAPSAKWTLDICVDQSDEWPISFSQIIPWPDGPTYSGDDWQRQIKTSEELKFKSHTLKPNEAILFSGSSQWHYRDAMPTALEQGFCHLLFFHFIPVGTSEISNPANWAEIFDIPELSGLGDSEINVIAKHES